MHALWADSLLPIRNLLLPVQDQCSYAAEQSADGVDNPADFPQIEHQARYQKYNSCHEHDTAAPDCNSPVGLFIFQIILLIICLNIILLLMHSCVNEYRYGYRHYDQEYSIVKLFIHILR